MAKITLKKVVKELKLVKVVVTSRYCGHGDHSMRLFSSYKPCYDGQWPLTGRYFKRCYNIHLSAICYSSGNSEILQLTPVVSFLLYESFPENFNWNYCSSCTSLKLQI